MMIRTILSTFYIGMKDIKDTFCPKDKQIFIINIGAPGSGKTYITKKILRKQIQNNFFILNLDTFIENNKKYIKESRHIYEKYINIDNNAKYNELSKLYFDRKAQLKI